MVADADKAPRIEEEGASAGMRFIATDDLKFYYRALWLRQIITLKRHVGRIL